MELLSVEEAAGLEGIAYDTLLRRIQRRKLNALKEESSSHVGYRLRVPLSELSEKAQTRYYQQQKQVTVESKSVPSIEEKLADKSLEDLTDKQREQAAHWKRTLEQWRSYISQFPKQKTEKTVEFLAEYNHWHPHRTLTERTLRHKWKLYREYGELALADGRADRADKGESRVPEMAWQIFLQWWLDESQPTVLHCYNLLKAWAKNDHPKLYNQLPSADSFYRRIKTVPVPVVKWMRHGDKKFADEALPFVERAYDLDSNDIWVSDYHTLDVFVRDDVTGNVFRPYVVVWVDIRSRKYLSVTLTESANSNGVISAFRKAAKAHGLPKHVLTDNGREFLVSDFGGRGRRKTSESAFAGETILQRVGVEMMNAQPGNPRAKVVERMFRILKEQFSRLYATFSGGRPEWKPHRLEGELKRGDRVPLLSEVRQQLELYLEGYHNKQPSAAKGLSGLSPDEAFVENLQTKRVASEEQLNLMMLRTGRTQKVRENGVALKFGDTQLWFHHEMLTFNYAGQSVYVRYDPEDLRSVRVYNEQEQFICVAARLEAGGYNSEQDVEAIKKVAKLAKKQKENAAQFMEKVRGASAPTMLEATMKVAQANLDASPDDPDDAVLEPVRYEEKRMALAVGADEPAVVYNMDRMIANQARKNR